MDRYEVVKRIGKGSFGEAHLVKDKAAGNALRVIKTVDLSALDDSEQEAALREAALLQAFTIHPNIVNYVDAFTQDGVLHICMEFCAGGDLDKRVRGMRARRDTSKASKSDDKKDDGEGDDGDGGGGEGEGAKDGYPGFRENLVCEWAAQLFLALAHIHRDRVVHRDIKLSNIFLTARGVLRLGDFGIARVLNATKDEARTVTGTPYYMSPELCQALPYSTAADIWAAGCALYELCTLERAFGGGGQNSNILSLVWSIVNDDPPTLPSAYSRGLSSMVERMLQKDPTRRPTAEDLLQEPCIQEALHRIAELSGTVGRKVTLLATPGLRDDYYRGLAAAAAEARMARAATRSKAAAEEHSRRGREKTFDVSPDNPLAPPPSVTKPTTTAPTTTAPSTSTTTIDPSNSLTRTVMPMMHRGSLEEVEGGRGVGGVETVKEEGGSSEDVDAAVAAARAATSKGRPRLEVDPEASASTSSSLSARAKARSAKHKARLSGSVGEWGTSSGDVRSGSGSGELPGTSEFSGRYDVGDGRALDTHDATHVKEVGGVGGGSGKSPPLAGEEVMRLESTTSTKAQPGTAMHIAAPSLDFGFADEEDEEDEEGIDADEARDVMMDMVSGRRKKKDRRDAKSGSDSDGDDYESDEFESFEDEEIGGDGDGESVDVDDGDEARDIVSPLGTSPVRTKLQEQSYVRGAISAAADALAKPLDDHDEKVLHGMDSAPSSSSSAGGRAFFGSGDGKGGFPAPSMLMRTDSGQSAAEVAEELGLEDSLEEHRKGPRDPHQEHVEQVRTLRTGGEKTLQELRADIGPRAADVLLNYVYQCREERKDPDIAQIRHVIQNQSKGLAESCRARAVEVLVLDNLLKQTKDAWVRSGKHAEIDDAEVVLPLFTPNPRPTRSAHSARARLRPGSGLARYGMTRTRSSSRDEARTTRAIRSARSQRPTLQVTRSDEKVTVSATPRPGSGTPGLRATVVRRPRTSGGGGV